MSTANQAPPASSWRSPGHRMQQLQLPDAMLHLLEKMVELQQGQAALTRASSMRHSSFPQPEQIGSPTEGLESRGLASQSYPLASQSIPLERAASYSEFSKQSTKRVSDVIVPLESKRMQVSVGEGLPDAMPFAVEFFFCSLGFLPSSTLKTWRRSAYFGFRTVLVALQMMVFLLSATLTVWRFLLKGHAFAAEGLFAPLALTTLCIWVAIMRELGSGGVAFILLHDMTRRGYKWNAAALSAKRTQVSAFVVLLIIIAWLLRRVKASSLCEDLTVEDGILGGGSSVKNLCLAAMFTNGLLIPFLLYVILGILWTTRLLCKLHQHELMWYANAMAEVLEEGQGYENLMSQLSTHELNVTFRLRCASVTWVRSTLLFLTFLCLNVLVIVTYLMSGSDKSTQDLVLATGSCLFMAGLVCAMGLPLAQVAEVFEYDVLHALNNPLVVKNAQQHFGQQLLAHLHTLGWGFRFGQTVINLRVFTNILAALLITIITSVSQAVLHYWAADTAGGGDAPPAE